jgi:hypothetical protein
MTGYQIITKFSSIETRRFIGYMEERNNSILGPGLELWKEDWNVTELVDVVPRSGPYGL